MEAYQACLQVVVQGHLTIVATCAGDHQLNYWKAKHAHCCDLLYRDLRTNSVPELSFTPASNQAFTLGMLYVMEGSALGAKLILKHLNQQTSKDHLPTHYYNFLADNRDWKLFSKFIESRYQRNPLIKNEVLSGAEWQYRLLLKRTTTIEKDKIHAIK